MKRFARVAWMMAVGLSVAGCVSFQGRPDYTASGALAGGATGAVIGSLTQNPEAGALIGGAVGALAGGLIGHGMDQAQEAQLRAQAPRTLERLEQGQPLTVGDVQALVQAGISDDLVISQIRNSRTVYHLNTADIIALKNAGVSDRVIDFMINTPSQIPAADIGGMVGSTPPAPLPETIVVAPGLDYIWVGGAWLWFGDRWSWRPGYWYRPRYPYGYHYRHHRHH
jgi:hypothetical protein